MSTSSSSNPPPAPGSLVWARLAGFPWWPAVVEAVRGGREIEVCFCGTQDVGTVSCDAVFVFSDKLSWCETQQKPRWRQKFRTAVEEAEQRAHVAEERAAEAELAMWAAGKARTAGASTKGEGGGGG